MNSISSRVIIILESILPPIRNTVYFKSFTGLYNDNPKQISVALHKQYPEVRQVWLQENNSRERIPSYAKVVRPNSLESIKYSFRAEVLVDNYSGVRVEKYPSDSFFRRILAKIKLRKRKGQLGISTWHGTPLKHIAYDDPNSKKKESFYTSTDYFIAGCELTENSLYSAFRKSIPVKKYGTPRNDALFLNNVDIDSIKKKLGIPNGFKVFLYAPTFRNDSNLSGLRQIKEIDFHKLFKVLNQKFGENWVFVYRVHNLVLSRLNEIEIPNEFKDRVINGNKADDMLDYILCSDVLLTDYSSSFFDFFITKKPCFLYTPDLEFYANEERGFYINIDQLPIQCACTIDELYNQIIQFEHNSYLENVDQFLQRIGNYEDGNASRRIVNDIVDFINRSKK